MSKNPLYLMSNPAYGYVNFPSHWSVQISNNGEFIHANPETTAKGYFDTLCVDPVEVSGSGMAMSAADGDIYDWTVPWGKWTAMSALQ